MLCQTLYSSSYWVRFLIVVLLYLTMFSVVFLWVVWILIKHRVKQSDLEVDGSIRAILPNHFKCLFQIIMDHGSFPSFFAIFGHRTFKANILIICRWKKSTLFCMLFVSVHNSELYKNIGVMWDLNSFVFTHTATFFSKNPQVFQFICCFYCKYFSSFDVILCI